MSIEGQGHFLTLVQGYLLIRIETCFSQEPLGHFQLNFVCDKHDAGHMTKMAVMPIYGINT